MTGSESAEVAAIVASGDSAGLPANDLKSSEERHSQRDTKKPQEKMREAAEVYLLMHRNCRVSRNIRANWYFEHLDKPVQIYSGLNDMSNEMLVYGMTPVDGADEEHVGNEQLLFTRNTKMIFFAKLYRQVYVLDLSPSTLVADDEAGCCLFTLLIEHFKACLYSLTRQMVLPGKQLTLRPAIYLTVLVYTPYLTFEEKTVLVQGTLVNHLNVHLVVEDVEIKFKKIVHSLHKFSQPIVDAWGKKNEEKKRQRTYRSFPSTAAPSTPPTGILKEKTAVFREEIDGTDYEDEDGSEKDDDDPPGSRTRLPSDSEMAMELEEMGYTRQQWSDVSGEATATDEGGAVFANASSLPPVEGYIHPEWSLIYMIRMAILAIQMLPENTQSNIIVITDAVCGMPEPSSLHDLLSTLRSFSIACSFIQVQGRVHSEPSFGHVASCELFHFLAVATFGAYLPNCKCILADVKKGLNTYQKQLMCFWFEKALQKNNHILSIVRDVNEMFADMYLNDLRRHAESRLCYECSIRDLMYVRLREGYTIKEIRESPRKTVIVLILPIRQLSCIEYTITAKGPMEYKKRQVLKAEVTLIAPYNVLQELIAAPTTANPTRQKAVRAYRDIIDGIVESDRILTHLHSFFTQRSYYTIPEGLSHCAMGLFRREDPPPTKLELHPEFFTRPRFDKFWCQLIDIEERIWQKWTHTHQLRLLLTPNEEVCGVFTNRNESLDFKKSIKILRQYLAKQASFCLLQDQIYVFFVGGGSDSPPRQFYLLRVTGQPPLISLRVSFIGGMTNHIRVDIIRRLSEDVSKLRFVRGRKKVAITEENSIFAATLLKRPMERLIVTYKGIPSDVHSMIAHTSSSDMIPSVSEHNALAKFMQARRIIWKLASMFCDRGGDLPPQVSNYFTDMMLRRRLALGYQLIWMKHGIVGLCRQMEAERPETSLDPSEDMVAMSEESRVALEQFVIFPPMHERSEIERIAVSIDDVHPQGCPAKNVDVVIVQEMWLEPGAMTDQACRLIAEEVLLASLFTVDKLLRICAIGGVAAPVRTFAKHSEGRDGTETRLIQFSLGSLMRNSQRHLMLLPFHCLKGVFEQDLKRAQMLMDILHEQLRENSECTLEVTEKHKWSDMVGDLERQTDYYADMNRGTKFVMYMRKTSPWSVVGVAIPSEKEKVRDWRDGALPLLFFSSAEPAVALAAMTGGGGVQYIEDRRKTDAGGGPEPADVPDDFVLEWRGTTEGGGFKSFNLTSYVRNMYDHLIMKSMVTCMFKAVNEGILVSDRALQDVTEEHCDFINLEVGGVDDALRTICSHLRTGQTPSLCPHPFRSRDSSDKCNMCSTSLNALPSESADDVDFELSFSSLLSRYFIPVAGSPSYFHYISRDSPMFSKMGNGRYLNRLAPSMLRRGRGDLLNYSSDDEEEYLYYRTGEGKIMRKPEDIFPVRMYSVESSDESLTGSMDNLLDINGEEMTPLGEKRPKFESRDQYPTPIFLYFSCGVRLPTGEMETFPINSLPSCIHHIIKRANLPLLNYNIDDVRVSLDLYILTWPVQLDAHTAGTEGASYAAAKRKTFLQLLPSRERAVIERLSHSISYLIEQEMVLMDSRRRELSLDRIERISNFISREMKEVKEEKDGRYDAMTKRLGLVIASPEAKERLKERLHGILVDYSMLKRVGDSDLFYACRVVDSRRFARHFVKEVPPPPIIITPQMRRAMKEEERRREKMEQEEKVKAIKKDVMRSLGYREDASQLIKAREEEEEALEEMEREEKKERRRVRVKRPKPPLVPAFPVEKKEGESEEKVVMSKAEELKKKIEEKKMEEAKKKKEEEERREAEEREKEDEEDDSEAADIIVPLPEPLDPEAERLRQLQELHEPQIPMGRRRIVDMDSLDLTKKDVMCDFWVIVRITDQIHIQFAQRYAHFRHTLIFDETWRKIKRALKVTNQQMLLEKAHETMEVNSLLLISDRERREYGSECIDGSIEPDPDSIVLEDNSRDQVTESARFYYTPGSFACPMVHHHWFVVPPRLKTCIPKHHQRAMGQTGIKSRDPPETTAIDVLRTALHAFAASNVENVYLFKDRLGAVFYMHLHVDIESVEKMSKSVPENIKKEADNGQFSTNVLLAVHGVDRPNEEITIDLPDMLQRQLNASHLDKIIGMFAKNKKAILEPSDVLFIQPEPRRPSRIVHFSVPDAFANAKLMAAFDFYVRQHLTHEWPEVRYRSSRGTAIGSVDRLAELRMMSCAQMSITPTIDEPPKEDEVEESERGTEEVSEIVDGNLAVSIPIPFTGGRNTATDEGERQEILEIMGIAETPVVPEEGSETTKTVKSAPEVKRERALRKLSGHIYRGKKSFEAHTSVMTPKLPPTYHPKFNVICKPKGPGSNAYGFAVAELRLMSTSGSVIDPGETELTDTAATALFDTTEVGVRQFEQLTRSDRAEFTAHKRMERLKHGRFSRFFKNEKLEKFEHTFMVELVVWEMGDVGDDYVKNATLAFIRQALVDCVTEYWMFTRALVDKPAKPQDDTSPMKPAASQPMEIPQEKEPPRAVSLSLDDAILMSNSSGSYGAAGGEPCCKSEGAPAFICGDFEIRREQAIPGMTGALIHVLNWFDFVSSSVKKTAVKGGVKMMAVQKNEVECASVEGATKVIDVIKRLLSGNRYARSDSYPDDVRVCVRLPGTGEGSNKKEDTFPGAIKDQWEGIQSDLGMDLDECPPEEPPSVVVVAFSIAVWEDSIRYSRGADGPPPDSLQEMKHEDKREQFMPRFPNDTRRSYIPRLRFVTVTLTGKKVTLYSYNLRHDLHTMMVDDLRTAVQWHEAKMLLLRQIGLHKMGITHLAPTQDLPYDEGGTYATRIWRCTESYLESDFPPGHSCEITPKECILSMSRLYRGIEPAFVTAGIETCFIDDQFFQLKQIRQAARSQLLPHHYLSALHARMMVGKDKITYADLCELVNASRETHFVMTPILLFPKWRRKIAGIRAPEKERERVRNATAKTRNASTASGFGMKGTSSARGRTVSTLSVSNSHASGLSLPPSGKSPSLRVVQLGEEDDPLHRQLEVKLLSDYVEYLISLGMKPVTIDRRTARTGRQPTGGSIVRWNLHPEQWMVTAVDGGLLLAHLCFTPPYFHVRFRMWHLLGVFSTVEDDHEKLKMRNLERAKDELVAACHVHSFTYDFHLRILSKYLLGRDHILFMPGYNTSAFLIDFLQYYGCRPPCARNCIYEERTSFSLQHGVHAEDVWAHFLKHDKLYGWRVVKMKQSEDDFYHHQAEFMLVQTAVDMHGERDEVKIVIHERSLLSPHSLNLAIYMVVVNKSHKTPLSDERRREDSRASEGEFKHVAPFNLPPAVPSKEGSERAEERTEDGDSGSRDSGAGSSAVALPGLVSEIERMVNLVNEGLLPSVVDGSLSRRRRFSSDGNVAGGLTLPTDQNIPIVLTPRTGDSDSLGSIGSLTSPPSPSVKVPPAENQLAIQVNAPRRHRRREESRVDGAGLPIAQERAIYVHFLSARQRKLQKIVEDATTKYRLQLQKCVQDAEFACRRDTLWQRIVAMPRHPVKTSSVGFFRTVNTDPWQVARTAAVRGKDPSKDLDTLISIVHKEKMADREPGLAQLTRGLKAAGLCRHLVARFGVERCRFFENKHAVNKKGLLITNPNCLLDAAILVSCTKETSPELIMMIKEYDDDETVNEQVKKFKQAAIDTAFDEVVSTVIAYVWATLNTRMELP